MKNRIYSIIILTILLSACQPASRPVDTQPTQSPVQPSLAAPTGITLDYSSVAQDGTIETVAAVPASSGGPYWQAAPQYRLLTLQGYTVVNYLMKPQIYIYPVSDLTSANENAGRIVTELQDLLQTQQAGDQLPFLPLLNETQVLHAGVHYLDFKGGKGVRYLTQLAQGMVPVNNNELIYTFQGLTSDGKYYIAAVLPVTNSELPADSKLSNAQTKALNDYPTYRSGMFTLLNQQPAENFSPDLNKLDALIRSIEIR
jgi:hypothetical protein